LLLQSLPKNLEQVIFRKQTLSNFLKIAVAITKIANTPAQLPRMLQAALQNAVHKKGVAVIGLPGDIANLPAVPAETTSLIFRNRPVVRPSEDELSQLAILLNSHKKGHYFLWTWRSGGT